MRIAVLSAGRLALDAQNKGVNYEQVGNTAFIHILLEKA